MMIAALVLAAAGTAGCRIVTDDVIRMRDIAAADTVFAAVDDNLVVAYAPLPGAVRILQSAQLARLARRHGIADGRFRDICFQRAMRKIDEQELLDTLSKSLAIPTAEVELVDFSHFPAPVGDLVFPRSGLALTPSKTPSLWKGYVIYGGGQHFPVWARVRLHATLRRVVATDNLVSGKPVRRDQVRIEPLEGVPDALAPAQSLDQVVGKTLLRPVLRGSTVSLDDISSSITVHRGDKVDVDLRTPLLHLRFEAAAEMDGRLGDRIRLRNLQSRNTFVGEVSGRACARVVLSVKQEEEANDDEINHSNTALRATDDVCDRGGKKAEGCQ